MGRRLKDHPQYSALKRVLPRRRDEDRGLEGLVAWCRNRGYWCWHTPNEGRRNPVQAAIARRKGLVAGVADLILVHNRQAYAIELKLPGEKPTPDQVAWLEDANLQAWKTFVGTAREAVDWLRVQLEETR